MSQLNSNESSNLILKWLIDLLTNKLNLQSALDDDDVRERLNSHQTNEDVAKIEKIFINKSNSDKISVHVITKKIFGWKFAFGCLLFAVFNTFLR